MKFISMPFLFYIPGFSHLITKNKQKKVKYTFSAEKPISEI